MTMLRMLRNFSFALSYHLYTIFLFTKSDYKTTVIPITLLAAASAPLASLKHLPHVVFWIWFHLLHFNLSNQTLKPEEDEFNKRWRPIPAKRITRENAIKLRWALVPFCWGLSICYSVQTLYASFAVCILTVMYDELGYAAGHWAIRNFMNGVGFMSFEVGAVLVAGKDPRTMDNISMLSILCSAGIFATTIQAQDFKDVVGDRLIGRRTLAIVAPNVARPTLFLAMMAWTIGLTVLWQVDTIPALIFRAIFLLVGGRFMLLNGIRADQKSYMLYNIWLSIAHSLPAYFRFVASAKAL